MRDKIRSLFYGSYGDDALNHFLIGLEIVFLALWILFRHMAWNICFLLTAFLYFFRTTSKNTVARSIENQKYMAIRLRIKHWIQALVHTCKDKENRYFVCPKCSQMVRIPRKRGRIEIVCPTCKHHFERKS